jgi:hypothetical protein
MQTLGIDIGGSGIKGAPVDTETGQLAAERLRIPTPSPSTPEAVAGVIKQILDNFGGYTQTLVTGAWRNGDGETVNDDSLKYEIAMDTGPGDGKKLVSLAAQACRRARQVCVMIQLAGGVVHFINAEGDML